MRTASICLIISLAGGSARLALAQLPPEPPDAAAIAALVEQPTEDCNGAAFYSKAEDAYREEMQKPSGETQRLPDDHEAFALMLQGARCRRFELPYSAGMANPPTEQPVPSSRLYWATAATLVERAERLRGEGKPDEARRDLNRVVVLGLQLYNDPGITYIQHIIALKTISMGLQGLGDLAIASGREDTAASCARLLARSRAYVDGLARFVREELPYGQLPAGPGLLPQVKKLRGYYDATTVEPVRGEILLFLGIAQAVVADRPSRDVARATLQRATHDPDERLAQVARWGLDLDRASAQKILRELQRQPAPLT